MYKKLNLLIGWLVFAVAAITYILTIEPTASFWDCGEFIVSAWKLEVGHPPGAPFFMMIARIFTLFAFGDVTKVALMVNLLSAMASAFTILFLFWSITHIAKRIYTSQDIELDYWQVASIMGAGTLGALAYTFSDSFWFSAVEGEVYAFSSFFTAIVFWAILKWENVANKPGNNRWILFIAYMMGLSIGVHLLNLLAIPAIVFIFYFKKYTVSTKGIIYTSIFSVLLLGIVQYAVIPGLPGMAKNFELLFTNSFGSPYNTGSFIYFSLLIGLIIGGIWYSHYKKNALLNLIILSFTVLVIGYSSYALIIIRSAANTPMDQNDPENVFDLVSYLNREQYGDRPLIFGQYFNSKIIDYNDGAPIYVKKNGKYVVAEKKIERVFDPASETLFPRMYSDQESPPHINGYIEWAGLTEADLYEVRRNADGSAMQDGYGQVIYDRSQPKQNPGFSDNLKFFFKYQLGHMYWRYFMWNFVGRQNDIQGHGEIHKGNWISGISFIDNIRLGDQAKLPLDYRNNKGQNAYFFLPLLFGILGMIFLFLKNQKDFWVVLLLFFMTGLAIILYLNQPPYQPRERDYSFAGSFYAFSIFIGLGILLVIEWLNKISKPMISSALSIIISLILVPGIMAQQNWDDHDRSNRTTARDFAYNYLNSCAPNAILFTNGDNDTFPLWYAQEVEGIRRDVRVINLSYLNTDWYVDQMRRQMYESSPVPFSLTAEKTLRGQRDVVYFFEENRLFVAEKYQAYKNKYEPEYNSLYNSFVNLLKNSSFPEKQKADFDKINTPQPAYEPDVLNGLTIRLSKIISTYSIQTDEFNLFKTRMDNFITRISNEATPLKAVITFIGSDDQNTKIRLQDNNFHNYLPTRKFILDADKEIVLQNKAIHPNDSALISAVEWTYNQGILRKADLMVLDLLATNNWERPVYFAITVGPDNYLGLEEYFQLEGLTYRVVPIKSKVAGGQTGRVNTEIMYENLMKKFRLDEITDSTVYFDENNMRMMVNLRNNFTRLANAFIEENNQEKAIEVLDKCVKLLPNHRVPYNYYNILMAQSYHRAGASDKAKEMLLILADNSIDELNYFLSLDENRAKRVAEDRERAIAIMYEIRRISRIIGDADFSVKIDEIYNNALSKFNV